MAKIYTKTGDDGTTSLFGGKRVLKSDRQIEAYGSVDELTSHLGLILAKTTNDKELLTSIQKDLHAIMGFLAGATVDLAGLEEQVKKFEQKIDKVSARLPELRSFILPQGGEIASLFHIARTTTRRAERHVLAFIMSEKGSKKEDEQRVIKYLNRLSDLFFILAREKAESEVKVKIL